MNEKNLVKCLDILLGNANKNILLLLKKLTKNYFGNSEND